MNTQIANLNELNFPRLVALVARIWRKQLDARLQYYQLTEATWLPLVYLSRLDKPVRQKELAAMLSLDSSSVVRVLQNLEKAGLIERVPELEDRRAKSTQITKKGQEIVLHIEGLSTHLESEVLDQFDPKDFEIAKNVLKDSIKILSSL